MRFRGAVSLAGGGAFVDDWKLGMAGVDGRFGIQINNLIGVYVQPHLSLGGGTRAGVTGLTGFLGVSALVDFTFFDRFFVAGGGGGGILNNPAAGQLHFRVGAYPLMGHGANGIRRKGLMIGADVRTYFAEGGITVLNVMAGIGYEAF